MHPRKFALIGGITMLVMGLLSFIPSLSSMPDGMPLLKLDSSYGLFLGIFAMNIVNKLALVVFGVWGIYASSVKDHSLPASVNYSRWVFVVMGIGAILGLIPSTNTFFGYWPLYGSEVAIYGVFAIIGAYFGFALTSKAHDRLEQTAPDPRHVRHV